MSQAKTYTEEELSEFKIVDTQKHGPFKIEEWISYSKKNSKFIQGQFKDKRLILIKYPRFIDITQEIVKYETDKNTHVYDVKYYVRTMVSKSINERKNLKPFGLAALSNKNVTQIGEEVNIEYLNSESWRNKHNKLTGQERENGKIKDVKPFSSLRGNKFQLFRPSDKTRQRMEMQKTTYKPPGERIRTKISSSESLVIKNIPKDMDLYEIKSSLTETISDFIGINSEKNNKFKLNILATDGIPRGIAFIDFNCKEAYQKVLNSNLKFKLGFNVLNIEAKKSKN
tara:strand:+ start:694 stop:1545 length:852 start_codon:yes stop_codon:yes gene_type:complete